MTDLAAAAQIVVAIGDCACFGGIPAMAPNPSGSTGLQFHKLDRPEIEFLGFTEYAQDHKPVIEQETAVGHAVRATLLYTGLAALANDVILLPTD